jgi:LPPG:FO 2-phospho-L-lactate transferase
MSDEPVATILNTKDGELEFQRYFVEQRCTPEVSGIRFAGADSAKAAPGVTEAIKDAEAVLIAPSNPYLSVDPILAIGAIADALRETRAPVVAVSPVIGGAAVKGPTAKLMRERGLAVNNETIARHYADYIDALLIDTGDAPAPDMLCKRADILMKTNEDRARVAQAALDLARTLGRS